MENSRTQNATRNVLFGILNRIVSIVIPFAVRTIIIKVLGEEYLGLNSLYSSILQVLSITELGFGNAIAASMYKPIAEKDENMVSALLFFYRKVYRIIGIGIFAIAVCIMPFLPRLINGIPPEGINIYVLFMLYVLNTVCSYIFFGYKVTLLAAHQRADLTDKIGVILRVLISIFQIIAIVLFENILLYVFLTIISSILYNFWCSYIADVKFPQYFCKGDLPISLKQTIKKNVIALAAQKIGNTISVSMDTIVISSFMSLGIVAIYGNYFYIVNAIVVFVNLVFISITAGIGNSITLETSEKNYEDFKKVTFLNNWLIGWCSCCLICLFQPFMEIWMGKNLMFPISTVMAIVLCFYINQLRKVVQTYKDAAGMWWADRFKPLVGGIINLCLNIILVQNIGVIGVVLSTIISFLFVEMPWETHVLFKNYFEKSILKHYLELLRMTLITVVATTVTYLICLLCPAGWLGLLLRVIICLMIPNAIFLVFNIRNTQLSACSQLLNRIHRVS